MGPAALALWAALAASAWAQQASVEAHEDFSKEEADVERTTAELEALAQKLGALSQAYPASSDFEVLAKQHRALHDAAMEKSRECSLATRRLHDAGEAMDIHHGAVLVEKVLGVRKKTGAELQPAMRLAAQGPFAGAVDAKSRLTIGWRSVRLDAHRRHRAARKIIEEEERAFARASEEHRSDEELRELRWGGGAVLLLLLLSVLWALRSRLRLVLLRAPAAARMLPAPGRPSRLIPLAALRQGAVLGGYKVRFRPALDGDRPWAFATELRTRRGVILRGSPRPLPREPGARRAALRAARALVTLRHDNILQVRDVLEEEGRLYLAYEPARGSSLREVLLREGRLPLETAQSVLAQAAAGLGAAHSCGILHGELGPSAILLTGDGVKVRDFSSDPVPSPYSAPEQERDGASAAADLYGLGACAYEMLTGAQPPPKPEAGLPKELEAFVRRAMDPEPGRRFASVEEFAAALGKLGA